MFKVKSASDYEFRCCTLDLETFIDNKEHKVLCAVFYDSEESHKFYIGDFDTQESLINALFDTILQPKYNKSSIYIHNGSSFDLVFLLKTLSKRTLDGLDINPIIKDGKILNIKLTFKVNNEIYYVNIRDSLLLLLSSLAKLAKQFGLEEKGKFPYLFPNKKNINYAGKVPSYKYFDSKKISKEQYAEYKLLFKNKIWCLKSEVLKYCELDCVLLYDILKEFSILIYDNFQVNIDKSPTLPSLHGLLGFVLRYELTISFSCTALPSFGTVWALCYEVF